jgi:tetratricopeptide (TPR) repeat protein
MDDAMTRPRCARIGLRWTTAGLLLLAGCGDAEPPARHAQRTADGQPMAKWIAPPPAAHADDRVVPAWYPFEDPPLPALHAADGSGAQNQGHVPAATDHRAPTTSAPALEPAAGDARFERLPPVEDTVAAPGGRTMFAPRGEGERTPAPPAHYVVDGPYSLGRPPERKARGSRRDDSTTNAPTTDPRGGNDHPGTAAERRYGEGQFNTPVEGSVPSYDGDAKPDNVETQPHGIETQPRGAPVFPASPDALPYGAARSSQSPATPAAAPRAEGPIVQLPLRSQREIVRPKDAALAEARPIGRFERLPPVEDTAAPGLASPNISMPNVAAAPIGGKAKSGDPITSSAAASSTAVASTPGSRNREMDLIGERAGECIRRAYDLANRGALYSADSEFTKALSMIAQGLDAQQGPSDGRHAKALAAGLVALEECDDFAGASATDANVDLALVVARHRTPVLKGVTLAELTPIMAMQRYYTFAQEQLALAAEHEPAASSALYGLGKIQTTLAANRTGQIADGPKAIALHQAALVVDGRNYLAANELGVLMARCGRYDVAEAALRHSLAVAPMPAVWNNLAALHDRLGQRDKAAEARAQAVACAKTPSAAANQPGAPQRPVVWMDTAAFAQSSRPESDLKTAASAKPTEPPAAQTSKKGFGWPFK